MSLPYHRGISHRDLDRVRDHILQTRGRPGNSRNDAEMRTLERVRLTMNESNISHIQGVLQSNRASLTLMLTTLQ